MNYHKESYYTNRELSWMDFNYRVLGEARDKDNPLLERVRFLSITQSNLDEFFTVRVASLRKLISVNYTQVDSAGMSPAEQVAAISDQAHEMVQRQYNTLNRSLLPLLEQHGIRLLKIDDLTPSQYNFVKNYFDDELYPALTPMADDSSRPFPFIGNNTLNIALRIYKNGNKKERKFATVQVPDVFPRVVVLPGAENQFMLIEDIIKAFVGSLFINYTVKETSAYRVIRDLDLDVAEEDTSDLLKEVQKQLKMREHGKVMRLEVEKTMSKHQRNRLTKALGSQESSLYVINGPLDLTFLSKLVKAVTGHADLNYPAYHAYYPAVYREQSIFDLIKAHDILMQYPYDDFQPVVDFIHEAAEDKNVLAIKMTLYRVSADSPIIKYLGQAAQNGKQVTVLVEVKARFDEENNVHWAKKLEEMGCHVIYGLIGLKTHCKLALVVRRENEGIKRYMHMGTGNYNDVTAHFYTDMGLFTADTDMGIDASNIFNMLSGYSEPPYFHKLHISPDGIRDFINEKLTAEIEIAKTGRPALVKMKMNSLSDPQIISKLYEASHAGVKIQLIIRGICCLRTGIKGVSDNIEVHSIIGRLLEHSRIYYFSNDGEPQIYLASADMMTRNLNRRVELLFPLLQPEIRDRAQAIFETMWHDTVKTRILQADNQYVKCDRRGLPTLDSQATFMHQAELKVAADHPTPTPTSSAHQFIPMMSPKNDPNPLNDEGDA
ncbi:RNA degradosome polyphosphate kinase [Lactobacillus sp. CBA3606]|uniref:RNA degradosome polyphosphate kinase n=1 Tax=Lactobacillus sp. CBA3606 TaxID=2099789 RepID=UPI000CFB3882|nr:RNA degradosome polyphosphate kinase [Lactobacillus sp. CBA3606]AVK64600.1 RNA degradosome polyphosphate kinase [Lactobacillus sp. CBA3606]